MKAFDYYGLFLTEESRNQLIDFIENLHPDSPIKKAINKGNGYILDHCTLIHKSKFDNNNEDLRSKLDKVIENEKRLIYLIIDAIGFTNKAVAFGCNIFLW